MTAAVGGRSTRWRGPRPAQVTDDATTLESGRILAPLTQTVAEGLRELREPRLSVGAMRCLEAVEGGQLNPPPARLILTRSVAGERFALEILWDPEIAVAFEQLPGARAGELKPDPWIVDQLDQLVVQHALETSPAAAERMQELAEEHRAAQRQVGRSRARSADPIPEVAARLQGELAPFQWAAVRYALEARQCFLADEQGLGKTVEALATLEADDAYPGGRDLPRVAEAELGARGRQVAAAPHDHGRQRPRRESGPRRHHDPQL